MAAAPRKVCVLGAGGVGKSLLAGRIAQGADDCGNAARAGTRVVGGRVGHAGAAVAVRLWDGPGLFTLDSLAQSQLVHSAAWLLVADGNAIDTLDTLLLLHAAASRLVGVRPALVLLNKSDLPAVSPSADLQRLLDALGDHERAFVLDTETFRRSREVIGSDHPSITMW